jgi:PKD repeat protein
VKWYIKNATVQVADDVHFVMLPETDIDWDIYLEADGNSVQDINQNIASGVRKQIHATIRPQMGSIAEFLISFAPLGDRRTIRNLSLEKHSGAFAVYIDGSALKKMQLDIEGDITLSDAFMQNIGTLKAKDLVLGDAAYVENIGKIEAENISMSGISAIRDVGKLGETAISVSGTTGITLSENSEISNVLGKIEASGDISLSDSSKIETLVLAKSSVIEGVSAKSISMAGGSWIKGIGSVTGNVVLSGGLSIEGGGGLYGRQGNEPKTLTAESISLSDNSTITNFKEGIEVTGNETFELKSGASIKNFAGTINTCAPISLDGNTTRIYFTPEGDRTIRAKSLDVNNGAEIGCFGADCNYTFAKRDCGATPTATLDINGASRGYAPLTVNFTGECSAGGEPVSCEIDFGDGSQKQSFSGTAEHTYAKAGDFRAILTATSSEGKKGLSQERVIVREEGQTLPTETLDVTLSAQSVKQGGKLSVTIECDTGFKSFRLENDLGMGVVSTAPDACPATLGPFTIPENASAGNHSFTLKATTENDETIDQQVFFNVEAGAGPSLGSLDSIFDFGGLSGLKMAGIAGIAVMAVAAIILIILIKKKGKPHTKPPAIVERKSEAQKQVKPESKPLKQPAKKSEEKGWPPKSDEKEAEALKEKIQKSAEKEQAQKAEKPGLLSVLKSKLKLPKPRPEPKPEREKPEKEEKGLGVEKGLVKKAAKEIEQQVKKPAEEKTPEGQAQPAQEEKPAMEEPEKIPEQAKGPEKGTEAAKEEEAPKKENIDILIEKLERVQAKKKGLLVPKAGSPEFVEKAEAGRQEKPGLEETPPKQEQERPAQPETGQDQATEQEEKPAAEKPTQPEKEREEPGQEAPEPEPEEETGQASKTEKRKGGLFSRFKKKPAEKEEEEEELPPWLKKEGS